MVCVAVRGCQVDLSRGKASRNRDCSYMLDVANAADTCPNVMRCSYLSMIVGAE